MTPTEAVSAIDAIILESKASVSKVMRLVDAQQFDEAEGILEDLYTRATSVLEIPVVARPVPDYRQEEFYTSKSREEQLRLDKKGPARDAAIAELFRVEWSAYVELQSSLLELIEVHAYFLGEIHRLRGNKPLACMWYGKVLQRNRRHLRARMHLILLAFQ